jgi:hypothetical protein
MFSMPISQEVREYQANRPISAGKGTYAPDITVHGITLWSLTPLLALLGQSSDYSTKGHWTAAAQVMTANFLSAVRQDNQNQSTEKV